MNLPGRMRALGAAAGSAAGLILVACVPLFTAGLFQSLSLNFKFDKAIAAGEATVVHTASFPEDVKVKKNFVQISGRITDGGELPGSVKVEAELADEATGKVSQKISVRLNLGGDGSFKASARIKKNIAAGEMMTVTLEPAGEDLAQGAAITLCVDLVKKKGDLKKLPSCVTGGGGGGGSTFSSLQADFLTPSCASLGCHDAGTAKEGLVLEAASAYGNLVNVPSQQAPTFNRVTPNDADNSYLIKKLRNDPDIQGRRMPRGEPALSAAEIQRFVDWIDNGAPND